MRQHIGSRSFIGTAAAAVLVAYLPEDAHAEVLDKVPGIEAWWISCALILVAAYVLGIWRPLAALATYLFSLILILVFCDVIWSDISAAVVKEGGLPYVVSAYATLAIALVGPAAVYLLRRNRAKSTSRAESASL